MYFIKFLILIGLLGVTYCQDTGSVYGFCSQVYAMNRFCMNQITGSQAVGHSDDVMQQPRVGKAGPKGEKGSPGDPGTVNYTAIEESIEKKIEETENRINVKFERLERLLEEEKMISEERYDEIKNVTNKIKERQRRSISGCEDVLQDDAKLWDGRGGVFDIYRINNKYEVYCDLTTDGGKWTVFQRRLDGTESFDRGWEEYAGGFGRKTGEFWLGLETIHQLTKDGTYELRIDLSDWNNNVAYAKYSTFKISGKEDNYRLTFSGYSGTAGDALSGGHNNMQFSAPDKDLDTWNDHCANYLRGGWWFFTCEYSHLNGEYLRTVRSTKAGGAGIVWYRWKSQTMKTSVMMLRKT